MSSREYIRSPKDGSIVETSTRRRREHPLRRPLTFVLVALVALATLITSLRGPSRLTTTSLPPNHTSIRARCAALRLKPSPPPSFPDRTASDRHVPGTLPVLITNATIWTGRVNGLEIIKGDLVLDKGLVKAVGVVPPTVMKQLRLGRYEVVDAMGAWLTPGLVDLHTHLGVDSSPELDGASDYNSRNGLILPHLRALDGLNTHDDAYKGTVSGGVTTALVLPGSGNGIGGQGFTIKLRPTTERSPTSLLLEPPYTLNSTENIDYALPPRWRQMKHACGENPMSSYKNTRMDNIWGFREAYNNARLLKEKQDAFCENVSADKWDGLGAFPDDLKLEALVDVLRGRVKVHVHCYEAVDLDDIVRLTNEFKFPIAAFHHAAETYLVPDLLKQAYEHPPAVALFATQARYKREAYRGSEFAPRILTQNGIKVVMKSDHPILPSRHLLYEAQQAYYYGQPENAALASVTTNPAVAMGMEHRVGLIREGFDADIVLWDTHPLALSATPIQVYIDGIPQLEDVSTGSGSGTVARRLGAKPASFQRAPTVPNFDEEARRAVDWEGLPPLLPAARGVEGWEEVRSLGGGVRGAGERVRGDVVFVGVGRVYVRERVDGNNVAVKEAFVSNAVRANDAKASRDAHGVAVVRAGRIVCYGASAACRAFRVHAPTSDTDTDTDTDTDVSAPPPTVVDLHGGALSPALVSFGAPLGLKEIDQEPSTGDGDVLDPLVGDVPRLVRGAVVRAVDGLQFATRDALLGYHSGTTRGITPPSSSTFTSGLSAAFSTGAAHKLERGAVVRAIAAMHVSIGHYASGGGRGGSIGTQIAVLRGLLGGRGHGRTEGEGEGEEGYWWGKVRDGALPLVIHTDSADHIASLLVLKREIEARTHTPLRLSLAGATESHLLAREIAAAGVGVIVLPARTYPTDWQRRRALPGPPLTNETTISTLLAHNVTVGIGTVESWSARNTRFDAAWAALEAPQAISRATAIALASTNLEKIFGLHAGASAGADEADEADYVATAFGDILDLESKVVGVIAGGMGVVDLF